ncbi:hypothetical protein [Pseudomonas oryzihabitans]|uniref:hypothetical protein n=1 Tax=Pseudomonas oryzihabitans TaxID=47885 RepID=UPI0015E3F5B2|nr:hypothetical protein [Pseudomonas psychrotolerans]MBA1213928.1 hypothetical protein [Pseudomonas psychrotolerans]
MKKATIPEEKRSQSHGNSTIKPLSKIARVLTHLVTCACLNRFEAERIGDHCLNSTINDLANSRKLSFERTPEKVPNSQGQPCDVIPYGLPASQYQRVCQILATLTRKRKELAA